MNLLKQISETKSLAIINGTQYVIEDGKPVLYGRFTEEEVASFDDKQADAFIVTPVSNSADICTDYVTNKNELIQLAGTLNTMALS